jgi:hypothetical protein
MSRNKNHNSQIATADAKERAVASSSAPLPLVRPSLPALNKKPQIHPVSAKKVLCPEQYRVAIAMSSARLGAAIKEPTKRITKHVGHAIAHEAKAKMERDKAQVEFIENIAYLYEAKQRLLNPGYRTDVDGGQNRTSDENQKNFGAPDWATFNTNFNAYSLQHADRLLHQFAKSNGLLTDVGDDIDDPDLEDVELAGSGRSDIKDVTTQERYEQSATAAIEITSRNPGGEVEKEILAAAESVPPPVLPLHPDLYSEVLSFITMIATLASDVNVKAKAEKLVKKMLLFKAAPDPAKEKNGQALGSTVCNPPTSETSEHVQGLELKPGAGAKSIRSVSNSSSELSAESDATEPGREETTVGTSPMPVVVTSLAEAIGARPDEVNLSLVQDLVDEDSRDARADSMENTLRPPANMVWTRLVPGKKYETRPAPFGGHGIYEPRSPVILQWYVEDDDARDAIDR